MNAESAGLHCPACTNANPSHAKFCLHCGAHLTWSAAERRIITVLFADLTGFTGLSERLDAEQVHSLITVWLDHGAAPPVVQISAGASTASPMSASAGETIDKPRQIRQARLGMALPALRLVRNGYFMVHHLLHRMWTQTRPQNTKCQVSTALDLLSTAGAISRRQRGRGGG